MIRVVLPAHLKILAKAGGEIHLHINDPVTPDSLIRELEIQYPALLGTIRDQVTKQRRPFVRYFACQEDLSHEPPNTELPEAVRKGIEPFLIVGAIAGG